MVLAALSREVGRPLSVEDITLRPLGEGEVRARVDAAAVCITDALSLDGMSPSPRPYIPGHSAAAVVEEVGPGCLQTRVGDRIVVAGSMECGVCYYCTHGAPSQCARMWETIFTSPFGVANTSDGSLVVADAGAGTMAEQMVYREYCFGVVESDLPAEQLALLGCGGISGVGAVVEIARVRPGDSVAIVGCGHLGLWMVQAARMAGASIIIAVEAVAERRDLAGVLGATHLIDPEGGDVVPRVRDLTGGRGVDVALEASGTAAAMRQIFDMTRNGGVVVPTSMEPPLDETTVTFPALDLALFGKQIRSSQSGGGFLRRDIPRIARMIEAGLLDANVMLSRRFQLAETSEAFDAARRREVITGVVLPN